MKGGAAIRCGRRGGPARGGRGADAGTAAAARRVVSDPPPCETPHAGRAAPRSGRRFLARARRRRAPRGSLRKGRHDRAMKRRSRVPGLSSRVGVIWALTAGIAFAATTPTPTPRPKLSGGFGRPRATPAAPADGGQSSSDPVRAAQETKGPTTEQRTLTIDNP